MKLQPVEQQRAQGLAGPEFLRRLQTRPETKEAAAAFQIVLQLSAAAAKRGGRALLVGGSVRDELLGLPVKDFDIEIYHLPPEEIETLAQKYGAVKETGKQFAILKLMVGQSEIDIAAPRRETKTGPGHKGFHVAVDPTMTIAEAARRRDFTINALAKNPISGEIFDPCGGLPDIQSKTLRVVDPKTFVEDPLRVLRGVRFAGWFTLRVESATLQLLRDTAPQIMELAPDRRRLEWEKFLLGADQPSSGLQLARDIGIFTANPEIQRLAATPQDPEFHPEGDVWTHTLLVIDAAQAVARKKVLPDRQRLVALLAALLHDVGKATTTTEVGGRFPAYGHEEAGVAPARQFMQQQGFGTETVAHVIPIILEHMRPHALYKDSRRQQLSGGAFRRLLNRLYPATIEELLVVTEADFRGRGKLAAIHHRADWHETYPIGPWLREQIKSVQLVSGRPEPLLRGRDLLKRGWKPGPGFGPVLAAAEKRAEDGWSREQLLHQITASDSPEDGLRRLTPTP